mmetsp:Transcript_7733/g.22869  ORF Transcript_7733/g.22869 Transcript_7733/m.22869 type:complete len:224 (+) Transcript_7733:516-1187(+)
MTSLRQAAGTSKMFRPHLRSMRSVLRSTWHVSSAHHSFRTSLSWRTCMSRIVLSVCSISTASCSACGKRAMVATSKIHRTTTWRTSQVPRKNSSVCRCTDALKSNDWGCGQPFAFSSTRRAGTRTRVAHSIAKSSMPQKSWTVALTPHVVMRRIVAMSLFQMPRSLPVPLSDTSLQSARTSSPISSFRSADAASKFASAARARSMMMPCSSTVAFFAVSRQLA